MNEWYRTRSCSMPQTQIQHTSSSVSFGDLTDGEEKSLKDAVGRLLMIYLDIRR